MPFAENLGTGGGALDAQYGSSPTANTNAPLLLDPRTSGNFVYMPGSAGNYVAVPHSPSLNILGTEGTPFLSLPGVSTQCATTPDEASLDVTGDLDVRMDIALDSWSTGGNAVPFSKGGASGWFWQLPASGQPQFAFLDNTANLRLFTASTAYPFTGNQRGSLRVTVELNVAGQCEVKFYTSTDFVTWTQLGTTQTGAFGVVSIAATTFPITIGGVNSSGDSRSAGKYYRMQIRNGINGTVVFDADFTQQALGSRGFIESTGKLVSLLGNAAQIVDGTTYGTMPSTSVAGGWTVPDSAALDVSDFNAVVRVSLNDWNAAPDETILSKWHAPSGQVSYRLFVQNGQLTASYSVGGVGQPGVGWGSTTPFVNGQTYWLRWSRNATTGVWRFDYAPDAETEPTVWTNVGGNVAGTAGALTNSTATTTIGAYNNDASGEPAQGRMYRAIIRNANTGGTKVLDADFTRQLQFASTFTEGSANLATVTTQGAARIERDRDLDLRVKVALDDWVSGAPQVLLSKRNDSLGNSYQLYVESSGTLRLGLFPVAGVSQFPQSTVPVSFADGALKWVRATVDVNNGSNGWTATFYTSDDGATWTILGAPVVNTGAISTLPTTTPVGIMASDAGAIGAVTSGKFFNAEIRNGIDGPAVLDIDFTDAITTGAETYLPDTVTEVIPEALQYLPNLGWGGTALNARFGSAVGADTNDPLLLTHTGTNYLYLPGVTNSYASSPNSAALNITGDIDIRAFIACDDWTSSSQNVVVGKYIAPNRSFLLLIDAFGRMEFQWSTNGAVLTNFAISTTSTPVADGSDLWVRVTLDVDNGAAGNTTTFFISQDGVTWAQLGTPITAAGVTSIFAGTEPLAIGQLGPGSGGIFAGKYYRLQIRNGIGGTVVFDADFTTGITSGAQTTFTESSTNAATVTINRSTSGRKSVAVVQDVLLFGTDDYLEVPDNDLLDFGATDSFTVMTAVRQWATQASNQTYLNKRSATTGYSLVTTSTAGRVEAYILDGAVLPNAQSPIGALGQLRTITTIRDTATDLLTTYDNLIAGTPVTDTTTASLANTNVLRLGAYSVSASNYADMEWRGSAIWRRALTTAELALVNAHYTTGPTAASTALMRQAVWWIDAGTRSVAQINRSTSGRKSVACARCTWLLGTDDFFEVPASNLFDFAQGQDYTLLVLHRGWWAQGTNDTLLATSSSTTASAAGWAMSNSSGDPWQAGGRHGDGSNGVTAVAPRRDVGALTGTFLVRDCDNDTLTAFTGSTSGTPVTDTTTGTIGNTNMMRLGRLSTTGTEYLDAEVVAAVVWRRRLTAAERNAVLAYYGV